MTRSRFRSVVTAAALALGASAALLLSKSTLASVEETSRTVTSAHIPEGLVIFAAALGGLVAILGVIMVFRGVGGKADVDISVPTKGNITLKNITQGVVITIIGTAILLGSLSFLRVTQEEMRKKTTQTTYGPDGEMKTAK